jgi:mannose-6-phosphate isomerase-like protein (cupin superfamily)
MGLLQQLLLSALPSEPVSPAQDVAPAKPLPSKVYVFENIPAHHMKTVDSRPLVGGNTVDGCKFSVHESALQPNTEPHPPHHHSGEEMYMVVDGTLKVTISGVTSLITKGSVAFVGSNDVHGIFNPGPDLAKYYVVEFGQQA